MRLDRFISERTEYSRSEIKSIAAKGGIKVNGAPVKKPDTQIDPDRDKVEVLGNELRADKFRYILLNKPDGYISSTDDGDGKTVMELIPPEMRTKNMFPAGRLDKDSLGALLITDDGDLAHRLISPKKHVSKIYIVKLANPFKSKYVDNGE